MGDIRWLARRHGALATMIATTVAAAAARMPQSSGQVVARVQRRPGKLALLRVRTDQQVQRQAAPGGVDVSVRRYAKHPDCRPRRGVRRGPNGSLVAVDAESGKERWVRENMNGMTSRGINYWESADGRDQRLIFSMNSLLQQVDAKTGKSIMSFGVTGAVDLRVGLMAANRRPSATSSRTIPESAFENLIILGSAPGEGYLSPPGTSAPTTFSPAGWSGRSTPCPAPASSPTTPGQRRLERHGGINNWGRSPSTPAAASSSSARFATYDFYGADRTAPTCSAPPSSRSRRAPASGSGTSSSCTTTSGTSIPARRRSSRPSVTRAATATSSPPRTRPAGCTCSTA